MGCDSSRCSVRHPIINVNEVRMQAEGSSHLSDSPHPEGTGLLEAKERPGNEDEVDEDNSSPGHAASKVPEHDHPDDRHDDCSEHPEADDDHGAAVQICQVELRSTRHDGSIDQKIPPTPSTRTR